MAPPAWKQPGLGPPIVVIVGPTASGKSSLALFLAERLNGEIINYDSVQLYRGLDIGSGKVSPAERGQTPHHLLDVIDPDEISTAGRYRRMALSVIEDLGERRRLPILAGGTGLYLRALLEGLFDGPQRSSELRSRLRVIARRHEGRALHRILRRFDPNGAGRIHPNDEQKLIRAIEVCVLAEEPLSALHQRGREALRGFNVLKVGLNPQRAELRDRIDRRVERMFAAGLIEETRAIAKHYSSLLDAPSSPLGALGYRQARAVLMGEVDLESAIRAAQAATRRYAKRQMTWWRRELDVTWFEGFGDSAEVQFRIYSWLIPNLAGYSGGAPLNHTQPRGKGLIHERIRK